MSMVIGLTGKAQSGKSTAAEMLSEMFGFVPVSFADPIKDGVCAMFGLTRSELEDPKIKESSLPGIGKSPRYIMQTLGTEWGRQLIKPTLWLDLAEQRINTLQAQGKSVVVVDVRFENEAAFIRRIGRMAFIQSNVAEAKADSHASEAGVAFIEGKDAVIDNNGSFADLQMQIAGFVRTGIVEVLT